MMVQVVQNVKLNMWVSGKGPVGINPVALLVLKIEQLYAKRKLYVALKQTMSETP